MLLLLFALASGAWAQDANVASLPAETSTEEKPFTFRSGVSNVRVDVQASEAGHLIPALTKDDFNVFDRGVRQDLLFFDRGDEPLSVLLLLDVSGSMEQYIQQIADVAQQSLKSLRPRDRVAVMIFARYNKVVQPFTTDFAAVEEAIRAAVRDDSVGSATEMNLALMDAAKYVDQSAEGGRRAIVILTDNKGLSYRLPDQEVIRALYGADVVVDALVVGRGERPVPPRVGGYSNPDFTPFDVFHIAEETGGEAVKAVHAEVEFPKIVERIRNRYGLQYRMPDTARPGLFRTLRVELTPEAMLRFPNAELRYRHGYIPR